MDYEEYRMLAQMFRSKRHLKENLKQEELQWNYVREVLEVLAERAVKDPDAILSSLTGKFVKIVETADEKPEIVDLAPYAMERIMMTSWPKQDVPLLG